MQLLDQRSEAKLLHVHPDLILVVRNAAGSYFNDDRVFIITEGLRTRDRQVELVRIGASQTLTSRHLTGHAVDLAPKIRGEVRWDWPLFDDIAVHMKRAAIDLGVVLVWGGDWEHFKDGPHFELSRKVYPDITGGVNERTA